MNRLNCLWGIVIKKIIYSINLIGYFFCFFLLAFFSFQSNAYPAPSSYFDTVQKVYIGYYQRPADPGGLIYWAARLDGGGGNLNAIIEAFANSAESQALYGTINSSNISTVVNGIYNALFGRDAEIGGLNWYVNGFNSGQYTPATIMLNVLYGAQNEDLQSVNNKLTAANLFTRTIDPELDGSNFQVTYAGNTDAIAARNFLSVYATSVRVPTEFETTTYIRNNIADPSDSIMVQRVINRISQVVSAKDGGSITVTGKESIYSNGFEIICHIRDGHGSTLPPHVIGKPLCVKGVVCQPGELLAFHVPTPFALDPPNLHLQIDSGIPTGQIPYLSYRLVVVTAMHSAATTACSFF